MSTEGNHALALPVCVPSSLVCLARSVIRLLQHHTVMLYRGRGLQEKQLVLVMPTHAVCVQTYSHATLIQPSCVAGNSLCTAVCCKHHVVGYYHVVAGIR